LHIHHVVPAIDADSMSNVIALLVQSFVNAEVPTVKRIAHSRAVLNEISSRVTVSLVGRWLSLDHLGALSVCVVVEA